MSILLMWQLSRHGTYFRRTADIYLLLLLVLFAARTTRTTLLPRMYAISTSTEPLARVTPVPIRCRMAAELRVRVSTVNY